MRNRLSAALIQCAMLFAGICLCVSTTAPCAEAQAFATQYKTESLSAYAGLARNNLGYYAGGDTGVSLGVDVTRHVRSLAQPSLEGRANILRGPLADEKSWLVGGQAEYAPGRFHPYAAFLVGFGTIHFNQATNGYTGDNSTVYAPGAGLDVDTAAHLRFKIDYERQYWNVGHRAFQPNLFTMGVTYTIPFRPFHRQGEPFYQ